MTLVISPVTNNPILHRFELNPHLQHATQAADPHGCWGCMGCTAPRVWPQRCLVAVPHPVPYCFAHPRGPTVGPPPGAVLSVGPLTHSSHFGLHLQQGIRT